MNSDRIIESLDSLQPRNSVQAMTEIINIFFIEYALYF